MITIHSKKRGSTLFMVIILVGIAAVAMVGLMSYVYGLHRINERALALERAEQTAEAGLHQILQYFYNSNDVPSGLSSYKTLIDNFLNNGMNPAAISASGMTFINASTGLNANLISLNNAKVTLLQVTAPRSGAVTGTVLSFKSVAVADTIHGEKVQRTAEMDVKWNAATRLGLPAAIISGAGTGNNGQFNLNWGQAWSIGPINLKGNNHNYNGADPYGWSITSDNNQVTDSWTKYMSAAGPIRDNKGTAFKDVSTLYDLGAHQDGGTGTKYPGQLYQYEDTDPAFLAQYGQTLTQKVNTILDAFDVSGSSTSGYTYWKNVAIAKGTYFRPAADGSVYNGVGQKLYINGGALNTTGAGSALSVGSAMDYYRGLTNPTIVFFDTKNGVDPNLTPSTNWANISFTGSIPSKSQGLFYVAGNLSLGGSPGQTQTISSPPPTAPATTPAQETETLGVFHNGVVFVHGNYSSSGNPIIYGSVVTRGIYDCGGTPNVYYNYAAAAGDPQPMSTRAQVLATLIH